jgi:SOS response regulatory protein OraA/RecX
MAFPRPKKKFYSEDELYEYAVGALARRMRTVAELKRLLRARVEEAESEYGKTLIELVIRRLKDRGYLNDSQYAAYFSSLRRDNQKFGRMRVVTDLKAKGMHGDVIDKAVDAAFRGRERRKAGARLFAAQATGETKRSEGSGAHLPATGAGRVREQDYFRNFEEVGCGGGSFNRAQERNRVSPFCI